MKRMKKKLISILSIIMIIAEGLLHTAVIAATPIDKANLKDDHKIDTNVEFWDGEDWFEVDCEYICYTTNNKKYPAYCITHRCEWS